MSWVGRAVARVNDPGLLRGATPYLDDLAVDAAAAVVVRSDVAHGRVTGVNAPELPAGCRLVGPDVIGSVPGRFAVLWTLGDQVQRSTAVWDGVVRYVGQPIAVVVGPDLPTALDAAESVAVEVDPLPVVVDPAVALEPDAPVLHPDLGTNLLSEFTVGDPEDEVRALLADCDRTLTTTLSIGRLAGEPMEPRGILVDPRGDKLVVHTSTQAPHAVRDALAEVLELSQHRIRVVAPAVGGGFGIKDHLYDDELFVVIAARYLGRPLRWVASRRESLLASCQARGERHTVEVGFDDDGRLRALWVDALRDAGAHFSIFGGGPLFTGLGLVQGQYRWERYGARGRCAATNRVPTGAYRGFGQTQAAFVRERIVELVAAELQIDPVELRLANMVTEAEHPWSLRTGMSTDNGDWPRALRRAREIAEAWPSAPDDGRRRGVGVCSYVQMAGIGPSLGNAAIGLDMGGFESAELRMEHDATVRLATGLTPHGQGQETTLAQLVADRLGIAPEAVAVVHSDTDHTPYSPYGTAASRSIAVGGAAVVEAAEVLATRLRRQAAERLEAAAEDIVLADGVAAVRGGGGEVPIVDLAGDAWKGLGLPVGERPGLTAASSYDPTNFTWSYGAHVCRVAVDPGTGAVEIERYAVVMDAGTVVNPMIVEGQIHGGVAQGAAAALLEEAVVGDDGQPLTTSLADYLVPDATFLPSIEIDRFEIPSPHTPGGMKGMGEGGTNGAYVCVVNGVAAALPEIAAQLTATPITPGMLVSLLTADQTRDR